MPARSPPSSSPGSAPSSPRTATSRRSCSATIPLIVEKSPFPISPSNTLEAGQVATILERLLAAPRAVPASRGPHASQQAHDQLRRARGHDAGDRRGQGVPRRLLPPAAAHRRLRVELLQDAQPTRPRRGANAAGRRSSASGRSSRSAAASSDRNTMVERDLSGLHPGRDTSGPMATGLQQVSASAQCSR